MSDGSSYYATHGPITDPKTQRVAFYGAPSALPALAALVRNVVFHEAYAAMQKLDLPAEAVADPARSDAAVRYVETMLERILKRDARSIAEARAKSDCFIGTCRDYATLLCSLVREQGLSARVRCGFAYYFQPDGRFGDDHWITEVWDSKRERWRRIDAEVDPQLDFHAHVKVDGNDIPRDAFRTAGSAWQRFRRGETDPDKHGVSAIGIGGEWFMAVNVIRDLAALNKREMLPFDEWGVAAQIAIAEALDDEQRELIDRLAGITADDSLDFDALRDAYHTIPQVRVQDPITSWPKGTRAQYRLGIG